MFLLKDVGHVAFRNDVWQSNRYLRNPQYADAQKLSAQASIHAKYGRGDWFSWLASQPDWPPKGDALEVGCGAGWFWAEAAPYLSSGLRIQLTDISPAMVKEAVMHAREHSHWTCVEGCVADVVNLRRHASPVQRRPTEARTPSLC